MASLGRLRIGSLSLKWKRRESASKYMREMLSPLTFPQPEAVMPPSRMERLGFGMISSGSMSICVPSPVQVGQAPAGLLKEKSLGASSSMEMPQSSQA